MNNYFRILPASPAKMDFLESLRLATLLAWKLPKSEITLFTPYPCKIMEFLDGILPARDSKKLVTGEVIQYNGIEISYSTFIDEHKRYGVILAFDCLYDTNNAVTTNYSYQIVLASADPDDYSLPIDYWLRDSGPVRF